MNITSKLDSYCKTDSFVRYVRNVIEDEIFIISFRNKMGINEIINNEVSCKIRNLEEQLNIKLDNYCKTDSFMRYVRNAIEDEIFVTPFRNKIINNEFSYKIKNLEEKLSICVDERIDKKSRDTSKNLKKKLSVFISNYLRYLFMMNDILNKHIINLNDNIDKLRIDLKEQQIITNKINDKLNNNNFIINVVVSITYITCIAIFGITCCTIISTSQIKLKN